MFCEKCGKEIKDGDKFCPYCGAENKINKEEPSHDIPPDFSVKGAGKKKKGAVGVPSVRKVPQGFCILN